MNKTYRSAVGIFIIAWLILLAACDPPKPTLPGDEQRQDNTFSIGKRVGMIVKLSRKGNYNLTYEGQMILCGSIRQSTGGDNPIVYATPYVWEFSIADADAAVAKDVEKALISGERVVAVYRQLNSQTDVWAETTYRLKAILRVRESVSGGHVLEYFDGHPYVEDGSGLPMTAKAEK
jgi:hypothetical protein